MPDADFRRLTPAQRLEREIPVLGATDAIAAINGTVGARTTKIGTTAQTEVVVAGIMVDRDIGVEVVPVGEHRNER